ETADLAHDLFEARAVYRLAIQVRAVDRGAELTANQQQEVPLLVAPGELRAQDGERTQHPAFRDDGDDRVRLLGPGRCTRLARRPEPGDPRLACGCDLAQDGLGEPRRVDVLRRDGDEEVPRLVA